MPGPRLTHDPANFDLMLSVRSAARRAALLAALALPTLALPAQAQAPAGDDAQVLLAMSHLTNSAEARVEATLREAVDEWDNVRYRFGGTGRAGIDCSALMVVWFRNLFDVELPRTSREQSREGRAVSERQLRAGDLVYFGAGRTVTHIGVYLGAGEFANSASSQGVSIASLSDSYWSSRYLGGRRVLPLDLSELPDAPNFDFDLSDFMDDLEDAAAPFLEGITPPAETAPAPARPAASKATAPPPSACAPPRASEPPRAARVGS